MAVNPGLEGKAHKALQTPSESPPDAVTELSKALNAVLADALALYLKSKSFHWHVSGPHFRDYHLLFEEQAKQILAGTDDLAERVRKLGGTTLRSIGQVAKLQRLKDNDAGFVAAADMLRELMEDNKALLASLREAHALTDEHRDFATTAVLDDWIGQAEERIWFLFEASRTAPH
jgi:starvation-inducible DNA-binding protein